jgi:hypothetical protein
MKLACSKLVLLLAFITIGACREGHHRSEEAPNAEPPGVFPARASALLRKADVLEVLSLNPLDGANALISPAASYGTHTFHGWLILGTAPVLTSDRSLLVDVILAGVAPADTPIAGCFNPRHGIHAAAKEGTVDLVICFECNRVEVYYSGGGKDFYIPSYSLAKPLARVLSKAGIPITSRQSARFQQGPEP